MHWPTTILGTTSAFDDFMMPSENLFIALQIYCLYLLQANKMQLKEIKKDINK